MKRARTSGARMRALALCAGLSAVELALAPCAALADASQQPEAAALLDTAPTLHELHQLREQLASADEDARQGAFAALSSLQDDALTAIRARLAELRSRGFPVEPTLAAMTDFRRIQGVESPEGDVDLALGVLPVLAKKRDAGAVLAAELIGYLRALEAQKSPAAGELIVGELFALDHKLFRYEALRTRERLSVLLIPALIRHRTHPKPSVRRFCEESLRALRIDSPGRAVQQNDVALLAAILRAYGDTLTFDAMPVVVSYVTDERLAVRNAALAAVKRFGKNAIWQLRERYVNATGKDPDPSWNWQRTLDELLRLHDAPKRSAFVALLDQAKKALEQGDLSEADKLLDAALLEQPRSSENKRASQLYARLAERRFEEGELAPALTAFRRALRLDPESPAASRMRARMLYIEAEQRLARGTLDLNTYEQAFALDPTFAEAQEALDELTGRRAEREQAQRRWIGLGAALLLVLSGLVLLRREREIPEPDEELLASTSPGE